MKKAKIIIGRGYVEFENNLNQWLIQNKDTQIHHVSHSETDIVLKINSDETMGLNSFSALVIYEETENRQHGKIKSRLPYIDEIEPNELKGML